MASDQVMGQGPFDMKYFLSGALAGGICCSITHGGLVPVDVVKTKIQLQPDVYNKGFIGGFGQVIEAEGMNGLLTGLGPTAQGYFIQGWFKFGGVEFFKINITKSVGEQKAWDNRNSIYLASSAMAEFIADIFLCPYEACRIRLVSDPAYADSMVGCASKMMAEQGFVGAFYSGFVPILCKQIPYTMAKFAVQGKAAENIYNALGSSPDKPPAIGNLGVSLCSGVIAGVAVRTRRPFLCRLHAIDASARCVLTRCARWTSTPSTRRPLDSLVHTRRPPSSPTRRTRSSRKSTRRAPAARAACSRAWAASSRRRAS